MCNDSEDKIYLVIHRPTDFRVELNEEEVWEFLADRHCFSYDIYKGETPIFLGSSHRPDIKFSDYVWQHIKKVDKRWGMRFFLKIFYDFERGCFWRLGERIKNARS